MSGLARKLTSAAVAAGLTLVPAGAFASPPAPSAAPAAATAANPWLTLSAMTSTSSTASAAALRHEEGHAGFPPLVPLAIILATIAVAIWIAVDDDEDGDFIGLSPP
jgi:hypothetical protein